jgi:hypothetical protein
MPARWLALVFATASASTGFAADAETRVFAVTVDGRPAGEFRLAIRTADDGSESLTATADIEVRSLLGGYRYSYRGTETWAGGRLRRLDSSSDDNGKKHTVHAVVMGGVMQTTVDGAARRARAEIWPTTYLRLPPAVRPGRPVTLLDVDNGDEQSARITSVGQESVSVGGKATPCTRVAVAGPVPATLHYDSRGRLIAQETTEDGHCTVLTLREIQR